MPLDFKSSDFKPAVAPNTPDTASIVERSKLGGGMFGEVFLWEVISPQAKSELMQLGLCNETGLIAVKQINAAGKNSPLVKAEFQSECDIANHLHKKCQDDNKLKSPDFNLSMGVNIGGELYILTKYEKIKEYSGVDFSGTINQFLRDHKRAITNDLDIHWAQLMASAYQSIQKISDANVLHLDVHGGNFFVSTLEHEEHPLSKKIIPINYTAVAGDYGKSKILEENSLSMIISKDVNMPGITLPSSFYHQDERRVSQETDLYSFRVMMGATLLILSDNANKRPWGDLAKNKANFDTNLKGLSDEERLIKLIDPIKNDLNVKSAVEAFKPYLTQLPANDNDANGNKPHPTVYRPLDHQLFQESMSHFFQVSLESKANEVLTNNRSIDDFYYAVKKLMQLPVSSEMKNTAIYTACENLMNAKMNDSALILPILQNVFPTKQDIDIIFNDILNKEKSEVQAVLQQKDNIIPVNNDDIKPQYETQETQDKELEKTLPKPQYETQDKPPPEPSTEQQYENETMQAHGAITNKTKQDASNETRAPVDGVKKQLLKDEPKPEPVKEEKGVVTKRSISTTSRLLKSIGKVTSMRFEKAQHITKESKDDPALEKNSAQAQTPVLEKRVGINPVIEKKGSNPHVEKNTGKTLEKRKDSHPIRSTQVTRQPLKEKAKNQDNPDKPDIPETTSPKPGRRF